METPSVYCRWGIVEEGVEYCLNPLARLEEILRWGALPEGYELPCIRHCPYKIKIGLMVIRVH